MIEAYLLLTRFLNILGIFIRLFLNIPEKSSLSYCIRQRDKQEKPVLSHFINVNLNIKSSVLIIVYPESRSCIKNETSSKFYPQNCTFCDYSNSFLT